MAPPLVYPSEHETVAVVFSRYHPCSRRGGEYVTLPFPTSMPRSGHVGTVWERDKEPITSHIYYDIIIILGKTVIIRACIMDLDMPSFLIL